MINTWYIIIMGVIRRVAPWCVFRGGFWRFYFRGARGGSNETRALSYKCKESTLVSSAWFDGWAFLGSVWRSRLGASAVCFGLRAMCTKGGRPCFPSAAAARAVLGFIWFPIVRARAPVAEGCDEIYLGGFPPPKPSGVCFFGIDYLVGLALGVLS